LLFGENYDIIFIENERSDDMINLSNADRILKQLYLSMVTEELNTTKEQSKGTEQEGKEQKEQKEEEDETLAQRFN
jgi:hypothetical protein